MAEIGTIASVVGVVGFVGQVIQGCSYLKTLIGDISDAPEEVRNLRNELDTIESVVKDLSHQNYNASRVATDPSLASCLETIAAVSEEIAPALRAFNDRSSRGKSIRRNWHRLKTALGKQHTKEKLDRLSRAKDTLVAAQFKISLYVKLSYRFTAV